MITPTSTKPMIIIHIHTYHAGGEKFLKIFDLFSKNGQAYPLVNGNAINLLKSLLILITHNGILN